MVTSLAPQTTSLLEILMRGAQLSPVMDAVEESTLGSLSSKLQWKDCGVSHPFS